jgi:transcriptional regulator with XRE-family HTH domain
MDAEMNTNAQLIRKLREERAWSQEHLAAVAGVSARTIQRVEAEGTASGETRMAIATALGVEVGLLNRVVGAEVAAAAAATAPPPSQWGGPSMVERVVWGLLAYVVVMCIFAYGIGKDAALRDGRADCLAKKAADCQLAQPR